jgi:LPPG:FO 2-phospho-L-lactate transferase
MADVCLTAIGVETSAAAVAAHYGSRATGGVLDAWLLAEEDAASAASVDALGVRPVVAPLWMRDVEATRAIAEATLSA